MPETQNTPRNHCRHIHPSGRRCASPSLRHEHFCYYHHTTRGAISKTEAQTRIARQSTFQLLPLDDRTSIQLNLHAIADRIAANALDPRRAGLLLYALQIASSNLPKPVPQPTESIEEIVLDDLHGPLAPEQEFQKAPHEKGLYEILHEQWLKDEEDEARELAEQKALEEKYLALVPDATEGTVIPSEIPLHHGLDLQASTDQHTTDNTQQTTSLLLPSIQQDHLIQTDASAATTPRRSPRSHPNPTAANPAQRRRTRLAAAHLPLHPGHLLRLSRRHHGHLPLVVRHLGLQRPLPRTP